MKIPFNSSMCHVNLVPSFVWNTGEVRGSLQRTMSLCSKLMDYGMIVGFACSFSSLAPAKSLSACINVWTMDLQPNKGIRHNQAQLSLLQSFQSPNTLTNTHHTQIKCQNSVTLTNSLAPNTGQ